uniref:Oligosaccharyltransferase complex subunit n=1 Tax=Spermophilus dauricus TaxID=99837 RepID=A0A8C9PII7_SPEDA
MQRYCRLWWGVSYFLITRGVIYDIIVEPSSIGSMTDKYGPQRSVAFWTYRVNGQYNLEGLTFSFLFTVGGLGFTILDPSNKKFQNSTDFFLLLVGFIYALSIFFMARVFVRPKPLGYLSG